MSVRPAAGPPVDGVAEIAGRSVRAVICPTAAKTSFTVAAEEPGYTATVTIAMVPLTAITYISPVLYHAVVP